MATKENAQDGKVVKGTSSADTITNTGRSQSSGARVTMRLKVAVTMFPLAAGSATIQLSTNMATT